MKKILVTGILIFFFSATYSQFSFSAKYSINSYPEWEDLLDRSNYSQDDFIGNGFEYGVSYWFRLKPYRVEFLPEISYQKVESMEQLTSPYGFTKESIYFTFNTQVYTLDIEGDCNCPTWGKDGSFIEKGFFVGVNPGFGYHKLKINDNEIAAGNQEATKFSFRIGVSTGLDIGIAKWITISPIASLNFTPKLGWDNLENVVSAGAIPNQVDNSKFYEIQPGLRLTLRPDYLIEQRKMFR